MTEADIIRANPGVAFEPSIEDFVMGSRVNRMHGTEADGSHVQVIWRGETVIWTTSRDLPEAALRAAMLGRARGGS